MFSREDLERLDSALLGDGHFVRSYPGLHYVVYPQYAFRVPDAEQYIRITRAPRQPGDNGLRFWVSAELAHEPNAPRPAHLASYLQEARFDPVSEAEIHRIVEERCSDLLVPPVLPLHPPGGFLGGLEMYTLADDFIVSLFAEYEDELIHFYWETTA